MTVIVLDVTRVCSATSGWLVKLNGSGVWSPVFVVLVKVSLTVPMVSVVSTLALLSKEDVCRTQTVFPLEMLAAVDVKVLVQPMEYSPPVTEIGLAISMPGDRHGRRRDGGGQVHAGLIGERESIRNGVAGQRGARERVADPTHGQDRVGCRATGGCGSMADAHQRIRGDRARGCREYGRAVLRVSSTGDADRRGGVEAANGDATGSNDGSQRRGGLVSEA